MQWFILYSLFSNVFLLMSKCSSMWIIDHGLSAVCCAKVNETHEHVATDDWAFPRWCNSDRAIAWWNGWLRICSKLVRIEHRLSSYPSMHCLHIYWQILIKCCLVDRQAAAHQTGRHEGDHGQDHGLNNHTMINPLFIHYLFASINLDRPMRFHYLFAIYFPQ